MPSLLYAHKAYKRVYDGPARQRKSKRGQYTFLVIDLWHDEAHIISVYDRAKLEAALGTNLANQSRLIVRQFPNGGEPAAERALTLFRQQFGRDFKVI